ncbi:TPA: tRNA-guanine(34) transglycosylase [Candidatus Dependentiae bacterium]|nr:MAG: Queuine tRNA-ribosyltransferase [candidate division TM6 bacterium GW2011_GWF2_36_131]KKQ03517.1 MAG: Queuine tRNA-ribosyltransferase [candidate division TM6 bacterium GW2011_GWE2_36_25]KKQ20209.1 MAG: Queuine tRNA-ribosyltransferase [candidate division TM6 bacterium GW2011_GWA2_36_9]HBR70749.1 tRNA-guanine(34) transglycosylase [Candidatus Dependentiae bacterium]HCU00134.1 tRNA-guanine(34) transglycosylase [Candidatus Dependentiae bacterium]
MKNFFKFEPIYQSTKSRARVGRIHTPHGIIDTPNFVAVGTNAAIKALDSVVIDQLEQQLIFCNTYHLIIQPGVDVVKNAGGLHSFMNRQKPIITDSGGFQVFSLAYGSVHDELKSRGTKKLNNTVLKLSEEGVLFRSYKDGSPLLLTPESSIEAQKALGADIIIPLDELPPYHTDKITLKKSLDRTHRWEKRSLDKHLENRQNQALYAVVHGGVDPEFRKQSADYLTQLPFDGFAIGGSFGKTCKEMLTMLDHLMPHLPPDKPNHLLGIGDLNSIEEIVKRGIDTFDSSYPTRCARHGLLFTQAGTHKITQGKHKNNLNAVDPECHCYTCKHYSAAYLHHLFKAHELSGYTLATIHNLHFLIQLVNKLRNKILNGEL